ncbi:unnamed protein product, partial [Brenthis ino]
MFFRRSAFSKKPGTLKNIKQQRNAPDHASRGMFTLRWNGATQNTDSIGTWKCLCNVPCLCDIGLLKDEIVDRRSRLQCHRMLEAVLIRPSRGSTMVFTPLTFALGEMMVTGYVSSFNTIFTK